FAETIKHCWVHTKILTPRDEAGISIPDPPITNDLESIKENPTEKLVKELQQQIDTLNICTLISVKNWLNSEGVVEVEQRKEEEEIIEPTLTTKKKLAVLHNALKIVTEMVNN
ncbi:4967_t:CDS:2, partial [Racocetra fulgida]